MATDEKDSKRSSPTGDLRGLLRQLVTPVIESVETRVSSQIDDEVAEKVDDLLATRMATVDRAIGDLDRHILELTARLDRLERAVAAPDQAPLSADELGEGDTAELDAE